jgi:hypothetical protein
LRNPVFKWSPTIIKKCFQALLCILLGIIVPLLSVVSNRPVRAQNEAIPTKFSLSPFEGYRGTWVRIQGSTFTKNTVVKFYFSSDIASVGAQIDDKITTYKFLGSVWTTPGGFIDNSVAPGNQAVYQVPLKLDDGVEKKNTPGGICYFYATYSNDKRVIALEKFTVTSPVTLSVAPDKGLVGSTVNLTGATFAASEKLTAKYDDREIAIISGNTTKAGGELSTTVRIPDSTYGNHTISITDETGNYAAVGFVVDTRIILSPTTQAVGGNIKVAGSGFESRKTVILSINGSEATPAETPLSTTQYGAFQATISIPFNFAYVNGGVAVISASTGSSAASAELSIPATPPSLKFTPEVNTASPASIGMTIKVSGMWFQPGDKVNILIDDTKIPIATTTVNNNNAFLVDFVVPPDKGGKHTLTAAGNMTKLTVDFLIETMSPPQPVLNSSVATGGPNGAPRLSWTAVNDLSGVTYDLQIASDRTFNELLMGKSDLTAAEYALTAAESDQLNRGGAPSYWRVRAVDGASNASDWSPSSSLVTGLSWLNLPGWTIYVFIAFGVLVLLLAFFLFRRKAGSGKTTGSM